MFTNTGIKPSTQIRNHFYSGNIEVESDQISRQNYYAFEWGDVLFVTLDVFWYSNISAEDEEQREKQKGDSLSKEEKIKLLDYSKVTAILIEAIKELNDKVTKLENKKKKK